MRNMKAVDTYLHHNAVSNIPDVPFSDMHRGVYVISLLAWAWVIAAFWFAFGSEREGSFVVAISTLYFVMFFGLPIIMARMGQNFSQRRTNAQSFSTFLKTHVETKNGLLTGREALIQIALIPVGLALCTSGIAVAVISARNAYPG